MQESCCQQAWCTYIFHTICGYRLVATINGALGYYYDIQPFSSRPILWGDERHVTETKKKRKRRGGPKAGDHMESSSAVCYCFILLFCLCVRTKCEFWFLKLPSFRSPCVWSALAAWSSTHILHQTRRNCFPISVKGSFCNYDNIQPRTSGSSLGSWAHFEINTDTKQVRKTTSVEIASRKTPLK